jgi:hypothetical protein
MVLEKCKSLFFANARKGKKEKMTRPSKAQGKEPLRTRSSAEKRKKGVACLPVAGGLRRYKGIKEKPPLV